MTATPGGYAAARRYAVVDALEELSGPTTGVVRLPKRLDWGPPRDFDLSDRADAAVMYETVLRESSRAEDLRAHLDAVTLLKLWPSLILPPQLRAAWEHQFPQLRHQAAA